MLFPILTLLFLTAPPAPDTLVVCPKEFRAALAPWEAYRRSQGHEILVVDVPTDLAKMQATIRGAAAAGSLKYVLLIGDVPSNGASGLAAWFGVQAIVNLGGVTGLMPVTGLTLPFFSAGGSSLFVSMIAAGLLLSIARRVNSPSLPEG